MQQPSKEETRNLVIAAVLSLVILVLWQVFFSPDPEPQSQTQTNVEQTRQDDPARPSPGAKVLERSEALARSERIAIKTPNLEGSLSLKGALIDELRLINYNVRLNDESERIELLHPFGMNDAYFLYTGWRIPGGVKTPLNDTVWTHKNKADAPTLTPETPILLSWDNGQGFEFELEVRVDQKYLFSFKQTVRNSTTTTYKANAFAGIARHGEPETQGFWVLHEGGVGVINGTLQKIDYSDLEDADILVQGSAARGIRELAEQTSWLGFTDPYWLTAVAPEAGKSFTTLFARIPEASGPTYYAQSEFLAQDLKKGAPVTHTTRFFAGAKEVSALREYQYQFDKQAEPGSFLGKITDFLFYSSETRFVDAVDWGWFFFLTKPIFEILAGLNALFGNMGVAIIFLTLFFKILLFPLAYKSFVSMSRMKKLQPDMKKLQERYKDDRQKLQQEMIALYKKEKVNPAAGCLPLLLQIPIFFSLYKVLVVSIELRHAPFFAWIQDLSAPDPTSILNLFGLLPWDAPASGSFLAIFSLGIWPILMGVSMWLQQSLNPAPTDELQAKIFNWLPIIFTFMLGGFASGLVIYWTANNTLTIIQQYSIMRREGVEVDFIGNMKQKLGIGAKKRESG